MTTTALDIASAVPGAVSALNYIAQKLGEFEAAGPRIRQAQHKAAVLRYAALQRGDSAKASQLETSLDELGSLATRRDQTAELLKPVTEWLRQNGFGIALPVVIAGAAVAAVAAMTYILAQTSVQEKRLDLLAQGLLTPDQLAELEKKPGPAFINFDLGKLVVPGLLVLGAWGLYRKFTSRGGSSHVW